jgi:hypothetical protein
VVTETDLKLGDGRTLHVYDTGTDDADGRLTVFWHHGTPNIGAPPEPLSHPRPGSVSAGCPTTGRWPPEGRSEVYGALRDRVSLPTACDPFSMPLIQSSARRSVLPMFLLGVAPSVV